MKKGGTWGGRRLPSTPQEAYALGLRDGMRRAIQSVAGVMNEEAQPGVPVDAGAGQAPATPQAAGGRPVTTSPRRRERRHREAQARTGLVREERLLLDPRPFTLSEEQEDLASTFHRLAEAIEDECPAVQVEAALRLAAVVAAKMGEAERMRGRFAGRLLWLLEVANRTVSPERFDEDLAHPGSDPRSGGLPGSGDVEDPGSVLGEPLPDALHGPRRVAGVEIDREGGSPEAACQAQREGAAADGGTEGEDKGGV